MSPSSTVHGGNYVAKNAPCEETSRGREFPPFNLKQLVSIQCPRHFLEVDLENMAHVFYGPLPARYILLFLLAKKIFLFCEDVFKETFGSPSRSAKNKKKEKLILSIRRQGFEKHVWKHGFIFQKRLLCAGNKSAQTKALPRNYLASVSDKKRRRKWVDTGPTRWVLRPLLRNAFYRHASECSSLEAVRSETNSSGKHGFFSPERLTVPDILYTPLVGRETLSPLS